MRRHRKIVICLCVTAAFIAGAAILRLPKSVSLHFIHYTKVILGMIPSWSYLRLNAPMRSSSFPIAVRHKYSETIHGEKEHERRSYESISPDPGVVRFSFPAPTNRWKMHLDFCYFREDADEKCIHLTSRWLEPPK